ncbi:hypothetical protein EN836_33505, partial [Mesorhizobium sp. M1C.F.Ca.ET.193.01.1.1]|uniref:hypothetical protein n=1 Tax=Mesorhizobium sp. M1C.F.Ca.ET.193.01.1.1 TaxID=2563926 RepID=UPI001093A202
MRRDAIADAPGLVVVEGVWPNPEELHALRKDRTFREAARPVRLILCGVPTAEVLAMPKVPELLTVLVGPLSMETLAHWMTREQFGFADDAQVQAALRDASGGWLECLEAMSLTAAVRKAGSDALIEAA